MASDREQQVIEHVLSGETEEFKYLLDLYAPQVFRLVVGIVLNREDAEEVTQDAFVRAYDHLASFRGDSSFSTWLYRIAYNLAVNHLRKRQPAFLPLDDSLPLAEASLSSSQEVDEAQENRVARLKAAIERLPAADRLLVRLFYDEEKPIKEIAYIVEMNEGAVKTRLCRIRERLEKDLKI